MATRKNAKRNITEAGVTRETLEEMPERVLAFLRGVGTTRTIRALLRQRGYTKEEHRRGWQLLEQVVGALEEGQDDGLDQTIVEAIAELDAWDEPGVRLVRAALTRHPDEREQVLDGVAATQGPGAVLVVGKILDRLDQLEETTEGKSALETLAARGIDDAERKRLAKLVRLAKSAGDAPEIDPAAARRAQEAADQQLFALRDWHDEWSEVARIVIKRRDHLIRLGLAERREAEKPEPASPAAPAAS
jgi:hypothetical protein